MSVVTRGLKCLKCGHRWRGLWDIGSSMQPFGQGCPECKGTAVRCQTASEAAAPASKYESIPLDSSNSFAVGVNANGNIRMIMGGDPFVLQREDAINLAAWLALLADPPGLEFCRLYNEIKNA